MQNLYNTYAVWKAPSSSPEGVMVASDQTQEWLLPWWWDHYSLHNDHPVSFVDFGLSEAMKAWCQQRGTLIPLPFLDFFVKEKFEFSQNQITSWEERHGKDFWTSRGAWFKKPLACMQSPYKKTLWLDTDCEVRGSIAPIFAYPLPKDQLLGVQEPYKPDSLEINSGVILFENPCPLILQWAQACLSQNDTFFGDQDVLTSLIQDPAIISLPKIYNWSRLYEDAPHAVIYHWHGKYGKIRIAHEITRKALRFCES